MDVLRTDDSQGSNPKPDLTRWSLFGIIRCHVLTYDNEEDHVVHKICLVNIIITFLNFNP